MPHFDWSVSLGTMIHLVSIIVGGIALYYKLVARITRVEDKHLTEADDIREIRSDMREIKRDLIGSLEKRVRALEIQVARGSD